MGADRILHYTNYTLLHYTLLYSTRLYYTILWPYAGALGDHSLPGRRPRRRRLGDRIILLLLLLPLLLLLLLLLLMLLLLLLLIIITIIITLIIILEVTIIHVMISIFTFALDGVNPGSLMASAQYGPRRKSLWVEVFEEFPREPGTPPLKKRSLPESNPGHPGFRQGQIRPLVCMGLERCLQLLQWLQTLQACWMKLVCGWSLWREILIPRWRNLRNPSTRDPFGRA